MKKSIKITLKVIGAIILLVVAVGACGWFYIKSQFLSFEKDYVENRNLKTIKVDGISFIDRNGNGKLDVYEDDRKSTEERVDDLLSQMTVDEKVHLLKGSGLASSAGMDEGGVAGAVGTIVPTPRLGIPSIYLSDGPAGLRIEPTREGTDKTFYCTAFPIATLLASTWNTELVENVGDAMGNEALEYGIDVILGPGVNLHRHPLCGRNFEYYSEDPYLTGNIGAAIVNGIEQNGVGTSVKHFVVNNQETQRVYNDAIVSERALREIYLKGFEIIVKKAQPWTIMSSYNKVNGTYVSENKKLLTDILRDEWGYEGLVMSDWFGGSDAVAQVMAGNDLLEPGTKKQWEALIDGQEDGSLSEEAINTSARRILKLVIESKKMDNYKFSNNPNLEAHAEITRQSATEGMVLLKNEETLPIQNANNIALLGVTSYNFIAGGSGSGWVNAAYTISLEEGLENAGYEINSTAKQFYEEYKNANAEAFAEKEGFAAMFDPETPPEITYTNEQLEQIANNSDIGIITIGRNAGEGTDRVEKDDFLLTAGEKQMIQNTTEAFHKLNKKVIVVLNVSGVIETFSWKAVPDAILLAWQGGQEGGNSVADILSGKVNPSGKLPMTLPINLNDHASNANFPLDGEPFNMMDIFYRHKEKPKDEKVINKDYTLYEEGIYVGYRHFDKAELEVSYPFGYGLSYSDFTYSDMSLLLENDTITASLTIENSGNYKGKEVVQFYVSKTETNIDRPVQELKAFTKTKDLNPGESQEIFIQIPISDLRYWNEDSNSWVLEEGEYRINCGASSRDIKQVASINI